MERNVSEIKNAYLGNDIYVVASGPTAGFVAPEFLLNKISIGINEVYERFQALTYLVRKDGPGAQAAYASGIPLIMSRHNMGMHNQGYNQVQDGDYYIFDHANNGKTEIYLDVIGTDTIVVSLSTVTSALHLAAYMGAANIILIGADCGYIDGQLNMSGYHEPSMNRPRYKRLLSRIEAQTSAVRDRLKLVYGCNVYSLTPWINLGLEGHTYERAL